MIGRRCRLAFLPAVMLAGTVCTQVPLRSRSPAVSANPFCNENVLGTQCIAIDATPDGDALDCIRRNLPNAPAHTSTKLAIDHLRDCTNSSATEHLPVTIVGHGMIGTIITGGGKRLPNDDVFMSADAPNQLHWAAAAAAGLSAA